MSTLPDVETAFNTKLTGNSALAALVGTAIFNSQADDGTPYPYVIFYLADGGMPNDTPGVRTDDVFRFEAVSDIGSQARQIFDAVVDAVHLQELSITGWNNYWMALVSSRRLIETIAGEQVWRYIGEVNVRAIIN